MVGWVGGLGEWVGVGVCVFVCGCVCGALVATTVEGKRGLCVRTLAEASHTHTHTHTYPNTHTRQYDVPPLLPKSLYQSA